ncbi:HepT-like ribonuclease domain-containing protein [Desulfosporosinus meridiei]|uniref:DUF86 domain-containing protein n=1 Tax=Desulfosporosinus meridiei (strain ATCC BAA-275 / DSM 13257 / KCTC 12902 / NCIMB 13706 / S10) TaxID=768704 RepID=J7IUB7_DESMD|nr:HepT-like ribonuclease domain-containing protein [Desulfosporosinus meridiei]AFQ45290.1 hypothetical protein Desmer_3439 [Desulfosporosinus meridiei DSM 13257]
MLPSIKNDLMYLLNILECIEKIILYSADCADAEDFLEKNEQMNFNATLNLLTNIGENVGKISKELKQIYSDVDWPLIKSFRNRVVHDYINIDTFMVFDIVTNDLKMLRGTIMNIVGIELDKGSFDTEEYEAAKKSFYYRHIKFD